MQGATVDGGHGKETLTGYGIGEKRAGCGEREHNAVAKKGDRERGVAEWGRRASKEQIED